MHALIEFIVALVALIAAGALAQFGVDLNAAPSNEREVHRMADCPQAPATTAQDC